MAIQMNFGNYLGTARLTPTIVLEAAELLTSDMKFVTLRTFARVWLKIISQKKSKDIQRLVTIVPYQ